MMTLQNLDVHGTFGVRQAFPINPYFVDDLEVYQHAQCVLVRAGLLFICVRASAAYQQEGSQ
jgi:hypothetical protein